MFYINIVHIFEVYQCLLSHNLHSLKSLSKFACDPLLLYNLCNNTAASLFQHFLVSSELHFSRNKLHKRIHHQCLLKVYELISSLDKKSFIESLLNRNFNIEMHLNSMTMFFNLNTISILFELGLSSLIDKHQHILCINYRIDRFLFHTFYIFQHSLILFVSISCILNSYLCFPIMLH